MIEIVKIFLRLGSVGFGGPIATIALMENEVVAKRRWISPDQFSKIYSLIKLLPGAQAVQMAIYLGYQRAGRWGGGLAGTCFILPSFILVLCLALFYDRLATQPQLKFFFSGMQITALLVIADSVWRMKKQLKFSAPIVFIVITTAIAVFFRPQIEPLMILGFGLLGIWGTRFLLLAFPFGTVAPLDEKILELISLCLKAGFLAFGTGLAIIPTLQGDVVQRLHWLSSQEFLDAVAVGQMTPGPVMITATFIGYKVSGFFGAIAATIAVFAPGFFNILVLIPTLEKKIFQSEGLKKFSAWAFPAVVGGILGIVLKLFVSVISVKMGLCFALATVIFFFLRPPVWIIIPLGGGIGLVIGALS